MSDRKNLARRLRTYLGPAGVAAGTAVLALALGAPTAAADVSQLNVLPGVTIGQHTLYGTGCTHQLYARLSTSGSPVTFYEDGVLLGTVVPNGGIALLDWVPTTTGPHTIAALQDGVGRGFDLTVGRGFRFGYSCVITGG
ncbi:hypothetical protein [Nocardia thailandica]|uniref:hypothetical protein n=1 Tax=Nocardia thailandica TaxID=257275 RepID=UPI0012FAFAEC|nr:hypothetical protein [Nocardia thailandica]